MEITFYKPTKKETGGAFKFNVHKSGRYSFMKAAKQIAPIGSERVFAWEDGEAINVKMGLSDLGAMLAVIYKFKMEAKLYHQTDNDNKAITFSNVPERGGFSIRVSHQYSGNTQANSVFIGLSYEEAMILKVYIENAIRGMLESNAWQNDERS